MIVRAGTRLTPLVTPLSRAADFLLPSEGAELLQRLLDGEEARIREALAQRTFAGPVCALALVYVWYASSAW